MGIALAAGMTAFPLTPALGASPQSIANSERLCPAQVAESIATIADQPEFQRARWGIRVETLGTATEPPQTLVDREGDRLFIPASSAKLLTTAAALDRLGPAFRIRTSVYADKANPNAATLRVVGRGDPSLTNADLVELAQQVRDRGIRHITQLSVDDRYFQSDAINPTWEWEDIQAGYGAPVTSFILNRNEIRVVAYPQQVGQPVRVEWLDATGGREWQIVNQTVTVPASASGYTWVGRDLSRPILYIYGQRAVGAPPDESSISVPNPVEYGLRQFRVALEEVGVSVGPGAIAPSASASFPPASFPPESFPSESAGEELASVLSPPLAELLVGANRNSENIYAESLLRLTGVVGADPPPESPLAAGLAALDDRLAALGIDLESYELADGSGLSRRNLVSPAALVKTLQVMAQHSQAAVYRASLSIAGVNGTLQNRFRDTPVEGRLYGKTGGLTGIASLSGYLDPPHYEPLAVSIIVSHSDESGSARRRAIDAMMLRLAQLQNCSGTVPSL